MTGQETGTKYEYTAAVKHVSGYPEPVGIAFSEDEYPDAKQRALVEYRDWVRDSNLIEPSAEVALMRRPISTWEVVDAS